LSSRDKSARIPRKGGIYEVRQDTDLKRKLDALTRKLYALTIGQSINTANTFNGDSCSFCASPMHLAQNCPSSPTFVECPLEQMNAFNDYRKQANGPFSKSYNPGWQNHPNFSLKQRQPMGQGGAPHHAQSQYPTGFHGRLAQKAPIHQAPTQVLASSSQSTLEDTLKAFMQITGEAIANMEVQMGQMANHLNERERGKLPSQPVQNLKLQFMDESSSNITHMQKHVQSIVTLRSRRQVDNQVVLLEENPFVPQGQESGNNEEKDAEPSKATPIIENPPRSFVPKVPYSDRLQAPQKGGKFEDILEVFKHVQVNIPFLDAIQQVPLYAKFLKDLIKVKRKTNVPKRHT
jgi:hypothetical protein